jgi:hypothetical protein
MPEVDPEIRCEKHDRIMYQCLVQGCTRYYCESLGGYLTRSEKGTLVPVVPVKTATTP